MESTYRLDDFMKDLNELIVDGNQEYKYELALHKAIVDGKINFCKTLINMGLIKNINYTSKDNVGDTLLIAIARSYYTDINIVKLLIDKGANINLVNNYQSTALLIASFHNKIEMVKLLIENGADINVVNHNNHTALTHVVIYGTKELIKLLVDNGADINSGTCGGKKVIDYTTEEIKKILTKNTHKYIDASGKEYPKLEQKKETIRMICCVSMDVNTIETETCIIEPDELMVKIWDDNKWICQKMNLGGTTMELPKDKTIKVGYHVVTNEKFIKIPADVKVKMNNEMIEIGPIYSE